MSLLLGNLSIEQMQERLGITFPSDLVTYLSDKRQANAGQLAPDKWHCFDLPFALVCENHEMAKTIVDYLMPMQDKMRGSIQILTQKAPS